MTALGTSAAWPWRDRAPLGDWAAHAACSGVDPDLFFAAKEDGSGKDTERAKEVCRTCVVEDACLEYALANKEKYGVWGGKSEKERRRIRRDRAGVNVSRVEHREPAGQGHPDINTTAGWLDEDSGMEASA